MDTIGGAQAMLPSPGTIVRITGLKNNCAYNDMAGTVKGTVNINGKEKAVVVLHGSEKELAVMPRNLQEMVEVKGDGLVFVRTAVRMDMHEDMRTVVLQEVRKHFPFLANSSPAFWVSHNKQQIQEELQKQKVIALINYVPAVGAKVACMYCMGSIRGEFVRCSQCCMSRYCSDACERLDVQHKRTFCSRGGMIMEDDIAEFLDADDDLYRYIRKELKTTEPALRAAGAAYFDTCGFCGVVCTDSARGLLICETCKCIRYCSTACSQQDWKQHKKDCQALQCGITNYISLLPVMTPNANLKPLPHDKDGALLAKNRHATELYKTGVQMNCRATIDEALQLLLEEARGWHELNDVVGEARAYFQFGTCAGNSIDSSQGLLNIRKAVKILDSLKLGKTPGAVADLRQDAKRFLNLYKRALNRFCVDVFFTAFFAVHPVENHPLRSWHEDGGLSAMSLNTHGTEAGKMTISFLQKELKTNRAMQSMSFRLKRTLEALCESRRNASP